jgi:PD-(D/E)XK nuclease superfamily
MPDIENKPWAADQTGQVSDYLTHLHVRYPGEHVLIYLSDNGRGPEASSIGDEAKKVALAQGRLQFVVFADLLPWLIEDTWNALRSPPMTLNGDLHLKNADGRFGHIGFGDLAHVAEQHSKGHLRLGT